MCSKAARTVPDQFPLVMSESLPPGHVTPLSCYINMSQQFYINDRCDSFYIQPIFLSFLGTAVPVEVDSTEEI